ncbi:MAG TPA: trypsin-like peptidase domain-containing protein [Blastocatellia bacterium]|nr:trypsin-like peptidase domain-containing protein [Blastocatellia bacterium]
MKTNRIFGGMVALALMVGASLSAMAQRQVNDTQRIHEYSKPAVVRIISGYTGRWSWQGRTFDRNSLSSGSGFIINPNGYILTNAHVVSAIKDGDDAGRQGLIIAFAVEVLRSRNMAVTEQNVQSAIQYLQSTGAQLTNLQRINYVFLQSGKRFPYEIKSYGAPSGEGKDLATGKDVAVIKIEIKNAPTLQLGNSDDMQVGDQMWAIGYPGAADSDLLDEKSLLEPTTNTGKISAKKNSADGAPILQTDTSITHGNSGGPAINEKGEVIGLTTFRGNTVNGQEVQGFNFLVPSNTAMEFVKQAGTENKSSEVDAKWREGLEHFWNQEYSSAQRDFVQVTALFPDHTEAAKLYQESQEHIVKGEDKSGAAMVGMVVIGIIVVVFLVIVVGAIIIVVVISKRKKSRAPLPAASPGMGQQPQAYTPQQNYRPMDAWQQQQAASQASSGAAAGYQPTVRLGNAQETELFSTASSPRIACTQGPLQGQEFPVGQGIYIGRDASRSQIVVSDPQVSGQHLWIGVVNGRVIARDNGSTNGTYLNGLMNQRITEVELKDRDVLTLGGQGTVKFTVYR